ncbi:DUF4124 domain-containing protein [Marinicella rhabdoformis]|uniref:DUF4124 domain-containing protein n=1 Tax=Marinicella rhabdoformis TaxID=2580566 RepID=UPI0012AEC53D|nr:DUF4124 domain-containing protein [Marinicella rhabdoformis]
MKNKMLLSAKGCVLFVLFFGCQIQAGTIYQCKNEDGATAYQDHPCDGGAIEFEPPSFNNDKFKVVMAKTLAKLAKESGKGANDPKIQKAAEVMAMTDAAKSYAFTQIHGVAVKHCGAPVKQAMAKYQSNASDIIALGKYYYTHGIHAELGEKNISQTGKELTDGLQGMLDKMDREHASAGKDKLKRKCKEAVSALKMLTMLYAN